MRNPKPVTPASPQWYEGAVLWGAFSFVAAIILSVIAATVKDMRFLLFLAWPFALLAAWAAFQGVSSPRTRRAFITIVSQLCAGGLYWLYVVLTPEPEPPRMGIAEYSLVMPSQSADHLLFARWHYENRGTVPITRYAMVFAMRVVEQRLSLNEELEGIKKVRDEADKAEVVSEELEPNDPHSFFDLPNRTFTSDQESRFKLGQEYIYVFAFLKYKDAKTKNGLIGITEWCAWMTRDSTFYHSCAVPVRTYTEKGNLL